jgi:hypothetical protein
MYQIQQIVSFVYWICVYKEVWCIHVFAVQCLTYYYNLNIYMPVVRVPVYAVNLHDK